MNFVDLKYVRLLSGYLIGFKEVGRDLYRFRCPFCGDSKRSKSKTRGYIYSKDDRAHFKCHNCGQAGWLTTLLQDVAPVLASAYKFERFHEHRKVKQDDRALATTDTRKHLAGSDSILDRCTAIRALGPTHLAYQYLEHRLLPKEQLARLWYTEDLGRLAKSIPGYGDREIKAKEAIVIPFFSEKKELTHIQCRMLKGDLRYMTFEIQPAEKIWGLDRIDWNKRIWVTEGPFDAMCLNNGLAVAGASILQTVKYLESKAKSDIVLIFDKDYRTNAEVYGFLKRAIDEGRKVVLFDHTFPAKDLNEQIMKGWSREDLTSYLTKRTFSGLTAKLELSKLRPSKRPNDKFSKAPRQESILSS